jgi:hypothetical protein
VLKEETHTAALRRCTLERIRLRILQLPPLLLR